VVAVQAAGLWTTTRDSGSSPPDTGLDVTASGRWPLSTGSGRMAAARIGLTASRYWRWCWCWPDGVSPRCAARRVRHA
jgi:hypothetical protein